MVCSKLRHHPIFASFELKGEAEAEVVVAVVGSIVVTIRDAAVPRIVPRTATAIHAVRPLQPYTLYICVIIYCIVCRSSRAGAGLTCRLCREMPTPPQSAGVSLHLPKCHSHIAFEP